jgi:hypothetical protein
MPVSIDEIQIRNLGPLDRLTFHPARINLIYGQNEMGKTFLVEFLIASLFRNVKSYGLRDLAGQGRVWLKGLEKNRVAFGPGSSGKLDDYLAGDMPGLPPDFSRLLVVKGAEVNLAGTGRHTDKSVIKGFLSGQDLLERKIGKINKTVQEIRLEQGVIHGPRRNPLKEREERENQLRRIDRLMEQIDAEYSGGPRKLLEEEKNRIAQEMDLQERARRYSAGRLFQEIQNLERDKNRIDTERLKQIRELLGRRGHLTREQKEKKEALDIAGKKSLHYTWLKQARVVYEKTLMGETAKPRPWMGVLTLAAALLSALLLLFRIHEGAGAALVLVIVFASLYLRQSQRIRGREEMRGERIGLEREFKERTGKDLSGLPLLEAELDEQTEAHSRMTLLKDQVRKNVQDAGRVDQEIQNVMEALAGEPADARRAPQFLKDLEARYRDLEMAIQEKKVDLARLQVESGNYEKNDPGTRFSYKRKEELESKNRRVTEKIQAEKYRLDALKQDICRETGDDINVDWETLVDHLSMHRDGVVLDFRQKTAEILGQWSVFQTCLDLRKGEDARLEQALQSPVVLEPMKKMTGRYEKVRFQEENLMVSDSLGEFPLGSLSTGAREQVLLAMRMGLSNRLFQAQGPFFLILDDAFQYSDWSRRELLVNHVFQMAEMEWQVFYLTMDDHLRKLFEKAGAALGKDFKMLDLGKSGVSPASGQTGFF